MYSKGVSWIDDCRIPFEVEDWNSAMNKRKSFIKIGGGHQDLYVGGKLNNPIDTIKSIDPQGRFPANLLVSDDMLNDGVISKSNGHKRNNKKTQTIYGGGKGFPPIAVENTPDDKGSNSRYYDIDKWFNNLIDD
jgi:hypothetical protein